MEHNGSNAALGEIRSCVHNVVGVMSSVIRLIHPSAGVGGHIPDDSASIQKSLDRERPKGSLGDKSVVSLHINTTNSDAIRTKMLRPSKTKTSFQLGLSNNKTACTSLQLQTGGRIM